MKSDLIFYAYMMSRTALVYCLLDLRVGWRRLRGVIEDRSLLKQAA